MTQPQTISIDGVDYVRQDAVSTPAVDIDGKPYVVVRTYSAGVHAGYLKYRNGKEVELVSARRIWFWDGAASLSQLAVDGTSKPSSCKFSVVTPTIILTEAIEIIPTTDKARKSITEVSTWQA